MLCVDWARARMEAGQREVAAHIEQENEQLAPLGPNVSKRGVHGEDRARHGSLLGAGLDFSLTLSETSS